MKILALKDGERVAVKYTPWTIAINLPHFLFSKFFSSKFCLILISEIKWGENYCSKIILSKQKEVQQLWLQPYQRSLIFYPTNLVNFPAAVL